MPKPPNFISIRVYREKVNRVIFSGGLKMDLANAEVMMDAKILLKYGPIPKNLLTEQLIKNGASIDQINKAISLMNLEIFVWNRVKYVGATEQFRKEDVKG